MKKFLAAAMLSVMSIHADAAVVISRPATVSRPVTISRPAVSPKIALASKPATTYVAPKSTQSTTNTTLVAATAAIAATALLSSAANAGDSNSQTVSVSGDDKDTRITKVSVPFLTLCTAEQFARAVQWQESCHAYAEDSSLSHIQQSCTLLSYQRFCEPATPEQVVGKRPVKSTYTNTFMRD